METKLKKIRLDGKGLEKAYTKTENDLAALQSVGQIIGDILKVSEWVTGYPSSIN